MGMSDSEINEAVARKLGAWTPEEVEVFRHHWADEDWGSHKDCRRMEDCIAPNYCHDIKAAWEVVEKFVGDFYLRRETIAGKTQYEASFWNNNLKPEEACLGAEWADTAPMAICLAFLKLETK